MIFIVLNVVILINKMQNEMYNLQISKIKNMYGIRLAMMQSITKNNIFLFDQTILKPSKIKYENNTEIDNFAENFNRLPDSNSDWIIIENTYN